MIYLNIVIYEYTYTCFSMRKNLKFETNYLQENIFNSPILALKLPGSMLPLGAPSSRSKCRWKIFPRGEIFSGEHGNSKTFNCFIFLWEVLCTNLGRDLGWREIAQICPCSSPISSRAYPYSTLISEWACPYSTPISVRSCQILHQFLHGLIHSQHQSLRGFAYIVHQLLIVGIYSNLWADLWYQYIYK